MKVALNYIMISVLFMTVLIGCTKEEEEEPVQKSNTELLIVHDWKYTNMVAAPPYDTLDIWILKEDCFKDNVFSFFADGTGAVDDGSKKCEPTDANVSPFSWQWLNNETEIEIIDTKGTLLWTNVVISSGKLTAQEESTFFDYIDITLEESQ